MEVNWDDDMKASRVIRNLGTFLSFDFEFIK